MDWHVGPWAHLLVLEDQAFHEEDHVQNSLEDFQEEAAGTVSTDTDSVGGY